MNALTDVQLSVARQLGLDPAAYAAALSASASLHTEHALSGDMEKLRLSLGLSKQEWAAAGNGEGLSVAPQ